MGERKTQQEKRCGNGQRRALSDHSFCGRETEVFRSHTTGKIQTIWPKREDLKLARLQIVHAVKSKTFAGLAVCHFTPLAISTIEGNACLVSRGARFGRLWLGISAFALFHKSSLSDSCRASTDERYVSLSNHSSLNRRYLTHIDDICLFQHSLHQLCLVEHL